MQLLEDMSGGPQFRGDRVPPTTGLAMEDPEVILLMVRKPPGMVLKPLSKSWHNLPTVSTGCRIAEPSKVLRYIDFPLQK